MRPSRGSDVGRTAPQPMGCRCARGQRGPNWEWPNWEWPRWELPRWECPKWALPKWEWPKWELAEWERPQAGTGLSGKWPKRERA